VNRKAQQNLQKSEKKIKKKRLRRKAKTTQDTIIKVKKEVY